MDPGPSYKQLEVKTKTNINNYKVNKTWTLDPPYKQLEVKTKTNINNYKVNKTWTLDPPTNNWR